MKRDDERMQNIIIFATISIIIAAARILKSIPIINVSNVAMAIFFGVFIGAMIIVLKNAFIFIKNDEQKIGDSGKNLIVFSAIAVVSLILTCILAATIS